MFVEVRYTIKQGYEHKIPVEYSHVGDSGIDLYSCSDNRILIPPKTWKLVLTGLFIELPLGYEGQIRSKSGLSLKEGLIVLNQPGTVDSQYRGECGVILYNVEEDNKIIEPFQKIAQLVICPVGHAIFKKKDKLSDSSRGTGGFGSTGLNK